MNKIFSGIFNSLTGRIIKAALLSFYKNKIEPILIRIDNYVCSGCEKEEYKLYYRISLTLLLIVGVFLFVSIKQLYTIKDLRDINKAQKETYTRELINLDTSLARSVRLYRRELLADKQFFSGIIHNSTQYGPCIETLLAQHKAMIFYKSRFYHDTVLVKTAPELQADYERALIERRKRWKEKFGFTK